MTRRRVIAWGIILLAEEVLLILFITLGQRGFVVPINGRTSSDFVSFYAAGKLALAGTPALAYDQAAHYLAEQHATAAGVPYQYFFYPPVFLFLCAGLATLPYLVSYAVFQLLTLALFVGTMRGVLGIKGWGWIAPLLAFPAIFWNIGVGQNAFLSAALLGGVTLLIDRRPSTSGMLLGLLCFKPHFGLLAPFALAAGHHWRAFFAATVTVVTLIGASIILFGSNAWQAYFAAMGGSHEIYESGRIDFAGMVTMFGAVKLLGFSTLDAYLLQSACALLMAGFVILTWHRPMSRPLRGATLVAGTLVSVPLMLLYDDVLALLAMGWLIRDASKGGFLPWEKILLLATYPLSLLTWTIGTAWHVPLGPVISLIILSLCLCRVWRVLDRPEASPAADVTKISPSSWKPQTALSR
jgi:alpha-1,2-mannosyltransferase